MRPQLKKAAAAAEFDHADAARAELRRWAAHGLTVVYPRLPSARHASDAYEGCVHPKLIVVTCERARRALGDDAEAPSRARGLALSRSLSATSARYASSCSRRTATTATRTSSTRRG